MELLVSELEVLGDANPEEYPLQPKKHSLEFLREIAHLRPRTNTFGAVLRVRHAMIFAVHKFFNDKGYCNIHSPIITGSDAEVVYTDPRPGDVRHSWADISVSEQVLDYKTQVALEEGLGKTVDYFGTLFRL